MDRTLSNSIETVANLLYLTRLSLDDPQTASGFLQFAQDEVKSLSLHAAGCGRNAFAPKRSTEDIR